MSEKKLFAKCSYCPDLRLYSIWWAVDGKDLCFRAETALDLGEHMIRAGRGDVFDRVVKCAVRARLHPHKVVKVYVGDLEESVEDSVSATVEVEDPVHGEDPFDLVKEG